MTKTVWLAIALMLFVGIATIAAVYASQGHEPDSEACRKAHEEGKCAKDGEGHAKGATFQKASLSTEGESHAKGEGHPERECSGHAEGEEHAKGEHAEGEGHANGMMGMMKNLSDEQRAAVHAKIKAMKAEGATHAQISTAVKEMLKEDAQAKAQATEDKPAASPDVPKANGKGRIGVVKAVFGVGHAFKSAASAVAGIF